MFPRALALIVCSIVQMHSTRTLAVGMFPRALTLVTCSTMQKGLVKIFVNGTKVLIPQALNSALYLIVVVTVTQHPNLHLCPVQLQQYPQTFHQLPLLMSHCQLRPLLRTLFLYTFKLS